MTLEREEESLAATLRQVQPKGMSVSRRSRAIPGVTGLHFQSSFKLFSSHSYSSQGPGKNLMAH